MQIYYYGRAGRLIGILGSTVGVGNEFIYYHKNYLYLPTLIKKKGYLQLPAGRDFVETGFD